MLTGIERAAIEAHRKAPGEILLPELPPEDAALFSCLRLVLDAGRLIRDARGAAGGGEVVTKEDGSPATEIEERIEQRLRRWLASIDPGAVVVGEETGGSMPPRGVAVVIDPIDGTRAFLTESETYSTTLALIRDGEPVLGVVANPATGEIAYARAGQTGRVIRLSVFEEPDDAHALGETRQQPSPVLVNVHPGRAAQEVVQTLYEAWRCRKIAMVRSPGGSPAWALVEAARGHFAYVNVWAKRPAEVYDLAAGAMIVRASGGEVVGLDGAPIDALAHSGPFVAGLRSEIVNELVGLLNRTLDKGLGE